MNESGIENYLSATYDSPEPPRPVWLTGEALRRRAGSRSKLRSRCAPTGPRPDQVRSGERRQMDEPHLPAEAGGASASIATKRREPSGLGASAPQGSGQGAHRKMDGARQGGGGQRRSLCESTRMGAVLVVGPGRPTCAAFQRVRHSASSSVLKLAHFTTAVRLSVAKSAQGTIRASSGRRVWRGTQG
jgi:hypothetical protein